MNISNRHPADELADAREQMRVLKHREGILRAHIIANPADRMGTTWCATVRTQRTTRIDMDMLKNDYADVYDAVKVTGEMQVVALLGISEDGEIMSSKHTRRALREQTAEQTDAE